MRRRHVPCQCLNPQKPDLSLLSGAVPVHIFGVQHLERQVWFSTSIGHSFCIHSAFFLTICPSCPGSILSHSSHEMLHGSM